MKVLSQLKSYRDIQFLSKAVSPGNHCPMRMASVIVEEIKGLSSLLIGTAECATHSRMFTPNVMGKKDERHWTYVLDEKEIIFGCKKGVVDSLKVMHEEGIKNVLLIFTCVPELIGEDGDEIVFEAEKLGLNASYVMLGQFKNMSYPPGSRKVLLSLADFMKPLAKKDIVNVIGVDQGFPKDNIIKDISKVYEMRYLAPKTTLDTFIHASDAKLNVVVSPYGVLLAQAMKKKFDIPYVCLHMAFHSEDITKALTDIEDILAISLTKEAEALKEKEAYLKSLGKLEMVVGPRVDLPLPIVAYLETMNISAKMIHLEDYYPENKTIIGDILKTNDPYIFRSVYLEKDTEYMNHLNVDFGLGHFEGETFKVVRNMFDDYGHVGYERSIRLIQKIVSTLEVADGTS